MIKRIVAASAAALAVAASAGVQTAAAVPAPGSPNICSGITVVKGGNTQIGGKDRYDTAVKASQSTYQAGSTDVVVLASGANFPDALAGAAIAGNACGPLLLTSPTRLPAAVQTELVRLKPASVIIPGGTGSVSSAVESAVKTALPGVQVLRASGANRYATAASLSRQYYAGGATTVYVTSGRYYADAASASAPAGLTAGPLLLADGGLPTETRTELARLNALGTLENVVILGGTSGVSAAAQDAISALVGPHPDGSSKTVRLAGADRFGTGVKVVEMLWGPDVSLPQATSAFYVNGYNWPDALAAGPVAAANDAPVLLTGPGCMPAPTKRWDNGASTSLTSRTWIGGGAVLKPTTTAC